MEREKGGCGFDDLQLLLFSDVSRPLYTFSALGLALPGRPVLN